MTIHLLKKVTELSKDNSKFLLQGVTGECAATSTTNVDWRFPNERWMTGGIFSTNNANWGDKVSLYVVDKDNILGYGAGVVLATFATDVVVYAGSGRQFDIEVPYVSYILSGLYVRLTYTNTGSNPVGIGINLYTHIPLA